MKPPSTAHPPPSLNLTLLTLFLISLALTPTFTNSLSQPKAPPPDISPSPSPPSPHTAPPRISTSPLDPNQLAALHTLSIPTYKDPCAQPSLHNATLCDAASPLRHLVSLKFLNCSDDVVLSDHTLRSLSASLQDLQFMNCPISPNPFPKELAYALGSFACVNSLRKLTSTWLSHLKNVTVLRVLNVTVVTNHPSLIFVGMKKLKSVTIANASLNGSIPEHWHSNLTHIDLSGNKLKGRIPDSITQLEELEVLNLSSNELTGEIPISVGDLFTLVNVSLASNQLSGSIPESLATIKSLVHVDLSSNRLNGTIPHFISKLGNLKYLNLAKNEFQGVLPFNESFIKKLVVFKVDGNDKLCYNHSSFSAKMKIGIAPCDKHGLPVSPPPAKEAPDDGSSSDDDDYADSDSGDSKGKDDHHHGPSKIVLGVAIGLSSIVFLIIFLILLSKWCH